MSLTVYPGVGVDLNKFGNKNRARIREKFHIPENAVLLLSVGELNDNKNHEAAIRAPKGSSLKKMKSMRRIYDHRMRLMCSCSCNYGAQLLRL